MEKFFSYLFDEIELSPLHKEIMIQRFVYHKRISELTKMFGMTRERIHQIDAKVLRKIVKYQNEHPDWMEELLTRALSFSSKFTSPTCTG